MSFPVPGDCGKGSSRRTAIDRRKETRREQRSKIIRRNL